LDLFFLDDQLNLALGNFFSSIRMIPQNGEKIKRYPSPTLHKLACGIISYINQIRKDSKMEVIDNFFNVRSGTWRVARNYLDRSMQASYADYGGIIRNRAEAFTVEQVVLVFFIPF